MTKRHTIEQRTGEQRAAGERRAVGRNGGRAAAGHGERGRDSVVVVEKTSKKASRGPSGGASGGVSGGVSGGASGGSSGESSLRDCRDFIDEIARIFARAGLGEIEIECRGVKLRIAAAAKASPASAAPAAPTAPVAPAAPEAGAPRKSAAADPSLTRVAAPVVGTAYLAAEPGSPPYIRVGDHVQKGQICMIIEAMKVMNTIAAPRAGIVHAVEVANAQPVEYGELLFTIK